MPLSFCRWLCALFIMNQSHIAASQSRARSREVKARGGGCWEWRAGEQRARGGGEWSCRMMTSSQSRIWVTSYLPLHSDTESSRQKKKELERELWSSAYMCPVRGSPSWRRDGGRIDWRWWTINEGIDFRVRVAGWGLEINWNKHINTSSILHPEHTRTLSQIYYEPCLA